MQINRIDNSYNTNFRAIYRINCAYIGETRYRQKNIDKVYEVASALSSSMYKNTLSDVVKAQVKHFFPDFNYETARDVAIARTSGPDYAKRIDILTGQQATTYRNAMLSGSTREERSEIAQEELKKMIKKKKNVKNLTIRAEEKNGKLTITGIELFQPIDNPTKQWSKKKN